MDKLRIFVLIIICALLFFYRYPFFKSHPLNEKNHKVFSPAYGRIMDINKLENGDIYIAIFLSPLDIHYQFAPIDGLVSNIEYDANGKFELAYNLNKSRENEKVIYTIANNRGTFKVYQIAGKLVRRITPFKKIGDKLKTGDTLGIIHFGSRVDIIIPNHNGDFQINVFMNQKLDKNTILGQYF